MKGKGDNWSFDTVAWSHVCKYAVSELGVEYLCDIMQVHKSTIKRWCSGGVEEVARPSLKNMIEMCNLVDAHPALMFKWEED